MKGVIKLRNSDLFLASYNRIDRALREFVGASQKETFSKVLKLSKQKSAIVRRYQTDLRELADLRNAIVHESTDSSYVIAEPHESTVRKIERIEKEILEPEMVFPKFNTEVTTFHLNDSLADVLREVNMKAYSQFPLYNKEEFKGLLSENGITNWLSKNVDEDILSLFETTLSDVLYHQEDQSNYTFINRNMSIYKAKEIFKEKFDNGIELDALLITQNGLAKEKLLGIMTRWDIIQIP